MGVFVALAMTLAGGCSSKGGGAGANLPLVTPPVRAAAPAGLGGTGQAALHHNSLPASSLHLTSLDSSDIKSRFFTAGPTNIYALLDAIDSRISSLNSQSQDKARPCLNQAPVAYTVSPFGQSVTLYAQCFERIGAPTATDPAFIQFGQSDGTTYYYSADGAERMAAILTPLAGASGLDAGANGDAAQVAGPVSGTYVVQAWTGVGYSNATSCGNASGFDDCSYGVIELRADSSTLVFEMSIAGIGFGYCGAQLKADAMTVYGTGSIDMATTCAAVDTFCASASDVTSPAACNSTTFELPALGRVSSTGPNAGGPGHAGTPGATWAASQYPGGMSNTITLDGTPSDSLAFGPTSPTPGVSEF